MSNTLNATISHNDGAFFQAADGRMLSKPESAINLKQSEQHIYVLPRNQVPTTVLSTSSNYDIEFEIPNSIHYIDSAFLEYQLANADGATGGLLVDSFMHFDYCTVLLNEQEVAEYRGTSLRDVFLLSHTAEKMATILPQVGIDTTTFASNLSVGAGATGLVRTPIFTMLSEAEVPIWKQNTRWKLRFRMRSGSSLIRGTPSTTIGNISVVSGSCKLLLQGQVISPLTQALHDSELAAGVKTFRYIEHQQLQLGLGNLTSGTPTTFNYTSSGPLSSYILHVNVSSPTGGQLYDSTAITSWDFLVNGSIQGHQLGDNQYTSSYNKVISAKHWSNCSPLEQRTLYPFSFSEKPQYDLINGSNNGSLPVNGSQETIRITPGANVTSAVVTVYGFYHSHLDIDYGNGKMTVHRRTL